MSSVADNNNSKELNFDNKQWQDAEFAQMITELKVNTVVTQLSLKKCKLGPKQAKIIAEMLMVNASLKKINLSDNNLFDKLRTGVLIRRLLLYVCSFLSASVYLIFVVGGWFDGSS